MTPATLLQHAIACGDRGDVLGAIDALRRAIGIAPRTPELHNNLGHFLRRVGKSAEAVDSFRQAIRLRPDYQHAHSNLVYAQLFDPRSDARAVFEERCRWGAKHRAGIVPRPHSHQPGERLRVGYVSSNFRNQAVNFFVEPIVQAHDRSVAEVFCYSDVHKPDGTTARMQSLADHWRVILNQSDDAVARQISADRIDILVDLTGHLAKNRMLLFARKPAPIQVSYIGDQATTGLRAVDWRITDAIADLPAADPFYTERLYRMPRAFFVYRPHPEAPPVGQRSQQSITLGSFNHTAKINPLVVDAWAQILNRVPSSKMIVLLHDVSASGDYVASLFADHNVSMDRVRLTQRLPLADYLALIAATDIALDSFPFTGHTTTCDTLWMGVPVVTFAGESYWKRMSASVLHHIGLAELIAHSQQEYIEIAVNLASDHARLDMLRGTLRGRMSTVTDAVAFTRQLEHAYRDMISASTQ